MIVVAAAIAIGTIVKKIVVVAEIAIEIVVGTKIVAETGIEIVIGTAIGKKIAMMIERKMIAGTGAANAGGAGIGAMIVIEVVIAADRADLGVGEGEG